jgi:hypothetical protein
MIKFSRFLRNLKEKLSGKKEQGKESPQLSSPQVPEVSFSVASHSIKTSSQRDPYFVQIGLDFGTSYTKCICRDVMTDKAWVHISNKYRGQEFPFLIPGALHFKDGIISHVENPEIHYPEKGLYHLKHALVKVALREWDDPVLIPYRHACSPSNINELTKFVEDCAVYYLGGVLGEVRNDIRRRFPDFGALAQDYMAVNLAVPVAYAEMPHVDASYNRVLIEAWGLAEKLSDHPPIHLSELENSRKDFLRMGTQSLDEACFIYPEVSANVQGFVRSRVSRPGMYIFCDTGASTVDQSVFIFKRRNHKEHLTYLHGSVLPLGSGYIERFAAQRAGRIDWQTLEMWRKKKELGEPELELQKAREWIASQLNQSTVSTLAFSKQKLFVKDDLNGIRVIFGGGGHCDNPYKNAVMRAFSCELFRERIRPDIVGLPIPSDLELEAHESRWMRRLSVAYGLSFEKSELSSFTYPVDLKTPEPHEIWPRRKIIDDAPTKDLC